MSWLVTLVTPPNGIVLDPFNGSGSTGKAAIINDFRYIGVDLSQEYIDISKARIEYAFRNKEAIKKQLTTVSKNVKVSLKSSKQEPTLLTHLFKE